MKCMAVPANLTAEEWFTLVKGQCKELGFDESFYSNREAWLSLFSAGMTVNEAVSHRIEEWCNE